MKKAMVVLSLVVVAGFGVVYYGCQDAPQNVVVEEAVGVTSDFSEFVAVPGAIRDGEWSDVYAWVQRLPRESLYVYDLVPHPTADFTRDAPRDMPDREEFVEQSWQMALHMRGFTRVPDASEYLRPYARPRVAPDQDSARSPERYISFVCTDTSGPDYGFRFDNDRGLDNPCDNEWIAVYTWHVNGSQIGSFIPWDTNADSGNCVIRMQDAIYVPKMTTPSMILCSVTPNWSVKVEWTDTDRYSVVRHKDTLRYVGQYGEYNIDTYQVSSGHIVTDRCMGWEVIPDFDPRFESFDDAEVAGASSQALLRSTSLSGAYTWFSHDGAGLPLVGQPVGFLDPDDLPNLAGSGNWHRTITGADMANWHNCYFKTQCTPWFRFQRFGSEGGVTSTCSDSTCPMYMQMGLGVSSWPSTCNAPPALTHFNRRYLAALNEPTLNCPNGYSPRNCQNGHYFSTLSWDDNNTYRPWREDGKIYFTMRWTTRFKSGFECSAWYHYYYSPFFVSDLPTNTATHVLYQRKGAGCSCSTPPQ